MENIAAEKVRNRKSAFDAYESLIQKYQQIGLTNRNIHKLIQNEMLKESCDKKIPGYRAFMFWIERKKRFN